MLSPPDREILRALDIIRAHPLACSNPQRAAAQWGTIPDRLCCDVQGQRSEDVSVRLVWGAIIHRHQDGWHDVGWYHAHDSAICRNGSVILTAINAGLITTPLVRRAAERA